MRIAALGAVIFAWMLVEAARASRNEAKQRARGGIEPEADVYRTMAWAYPGVFLAMLVEGALRGSAPPVLFAGGVALFALAKALKWWAILTLGDAWTFRVIVVPNMTRVTAGPYRFAAHPNYVGVIGEIAGVACMAPAFISGPLGALFFGSLIWRRVRVERAALNAILRP